MQRMTELRVAIAITTVWLSGSAGWVRAEGGAAADRPALRVFAAASLTEVVEALAREFPDGPVQTSFGASSDLARQIADGAPADVFLSASPDWVDFLAEAALVDDEPVLFARNALVCIAPQAGRLAREGSAASPERLVAALEDDDLVAIANPGVPAGEYARAALGRLGLLAGLESRLVGQKDVRAVLHAVEQGRSPPASSTRPTRASLGSRRSSPSIPRPIRRSSTRRSPCDRRSSSSGRGASSPTSRARRRGRACRRPGLCFRSPR